MRALYVILAFALLCSGCIVVSDSPAPGCRKYFAMAPTGGCDGKAIIKSLSVESQAECLGFQVNNCNGGIVTLTNDCDENISFAGMRINSTDKRANFELSRGKDGSVSAVHAKGNFATYYPDEEELLSAEGKVGNRRFNVSYVKTEYLC